MANLTGEYDVTVEVSVAAVNRVLAAIHENEDPSFPILPHSLDMFVDDTPRGPGDPVPESERTGVQTPAEAQVSTPTLSLPQGGIVTDGLAWAARTARGVGPWRPFQPSDVSIRASVRAWVKGSPQPSLPEFIHGDVIMNANVVRTTFDLPTLEQVPSGAMARVVGGVLGGIRLPFGETFIGLDRTSGLGVVFQPAAGTTVSDEERLRIQQVILNALRGDLDPVTFQVSVPEDVHAWDYKLDPDHASVMVALELGTQTPGPGAVDAIGGGLVPAGSDFAISVGRDFILPMLRSQVVQGLEPSYSFSQWGVSAHVRPDWDASGFDLQPGRIVLTVTGDGDISWWGVDDHFTFTVRIAFTLVIIDGGLELVADGDPEVDLSDVAVGGGYIEGKARSRIRDERDDALAAGRNQIREALRVQDRLDDILAGLHPSPAGASVTGVQIRSDGIVVAGKISLAPSRPVVVRQVRRAGMIDALESWIPGGTIDRFRWYRSEPVATPFIFGGGFGGGLPQLTVEGTEEHRFVTEEDPLGAVVAPVLCLEVQGTRVVAGGGTAPVSGHTCGFYHPVPPFPISGFAVIGTRALPVLPMQGLRPDGVIGTVGHYSLVVHFAAGRWDHTVAALQEALGGLRETAVVVAVLFPHGELERATRERIETEAAFLVGEDVDDQWSDTFEVSGRPATVLVDPRGRVAWREEGSLTPAKLAKALKQHATGGGRVSFQPLRLGVAAGDTPPEFLFRIGRGAELSMRRLRGRRVALTFWTSWSDPSVEQLREFARAYEATRGVGPLVLAIGEGETEERAAQIAKEEGLPFPVLPDPDREISRRFGVGCWPTTVWIGPTMRVEAVNFGLTAVADRPEHVDGVPTYR